MGKRDKEFYEKQIKFYMRQIEFDNHSIAHCNRMMKSEKSYYGFETREYDKLKKSAQNIIESVSTTESSLKNIRSWQPHKQNNPPRRLRGIKNNAPLVQRLERTSYKRVTRFRLP